MKIAFLLYNGMTALDFVGPHEILSRLPNTNSFRVGLEAGPILSCSGLSLYADYSLSDVNEADILVVPGASSATSLSSHSDILEWIQQIHQTTAWTTSICTGSLILGAAGILHGVKATTHWAAFERLGSWGAKPIHSRVVEDGKIMTAAGVSAGIDMALTLSSEVIGPEFAQAMQLALEYDPDPPFDTGSPKKVSKEVRDEVKSRMISRFEREQNNSGMV